MRYLLLLVLLMFSNGCSYLAERERQKAIAWAKIYQPRNQELSNVIDKPNTTSLNIESDKKQTNEDKFNTAENIKSQIPTKSDTNSFIKELPDKSKKIKSAGVYRYVAPDGRVFYTDEPSDKQYKLIVPVPTNKPPLAVKQKTNTKNTRINLVGNSHQKEMIDKKLDALADKFIIRATVYCKRDIEKLSSYNSRWTDGFFETKFSKVRWLDIKKGVISYMGDKIEFQNVFGAYQNYIYECDFDTTSQKVLDTRAYPGRL
jgi:hypothetical protein